MRHRKKKTALPLRGSGGPKTGSKYTNKSVDALLLGKIFHRQKESYDGIAYNLKQRVAVLYRFDRTARGEFETLTVSDLPEQNGILAINIMRFCYGIRAAEEVYTDVEKYIKRKIANTPDVCLN